MHAEGLSEPEEMSHLQPDLAAEDPGELLRIQARPLGDLPDRAARQLDQGPDQSRQPARFLLLGIGHGEKYSDFPRRSSRERRLMFLLDVRQVSRGGSSWQRARTNWEDLCRTALISSGSRTSARETS